MSTQAYLDSLESQSRRYPRYQWLLNYLQRDRKFLKERIHPVVLGRTRTMIADFFSNQSRPPSILCPDSNENLERALANRSDSAAVRLIFVVSVSGVSEQMRKLKQLEQLSTTSQGSMSRNSPNHQPSAPVVTRGRSAGVLDSHPIMGHTSHLPEPEALNCIAAVIQLDPGLLLRHLDQQEHLIYRRHSQKGQRPGAARKQEAWLDFSIGVDQANYITAMVHTESDQTDKEPKHHTVLLLVNEDNCLGIDFNMYTSNLDQPLQPCNGSLYETFETGLRAKNEDEQGEIIEEPLNLVRDYYALLLDSFSRQLELYCRRWNVLYEPYVNTSAVYGNAEGRRHVRIESAQLSVHLQYIRRSLQSLEQIKHEKLSNNSGAPSHDFDLDDLIRDLQQMSMQVESLKSAYDTFIEHQARNITREEARQPTTEARDLLQRLCYLGFVFAPLSLATSVFSINIWPLESPAPLWAFVVTALFVLGASILTLLWLNHQVQKAMKRDGMPGAARLPPRQQKGTHYISLLHSDPEYSENTQLRPPPNREEFADRPYTSTIESQITTPPPPPRKQQQKGSSPAPPDTASSQSYGFQDETRRLLRAVPERNEFAGRPRTTTEPQKTAASSSRIYPSYHDTSSSESHDSDSS